MISDEKDRWECLKLAVSASASHPNKPASDKIGAWIVATAKTFESYISGNEVITIEGKLTAEQVTEFKRLWKERYDGRAA